MNFTKTKKKGNSSQDQKVALSRESSFKSTNPLKLQLPNQISSRRVSTNNPNKLSRNATKSFHEMKIPEFDKV